MSALLKRRASKLIHLEALYHQSLPHRSHTPYQASTHPPLSKGLLHLRDTKVGHMIKTHPYPGERDTLKFFWVPKTRFKFYSGDTLALKRYMVCN